MQLASAWCLPRMACLPRTLLITAWLTTAQLERKVTTSVVGEIVEKHCRWEMMLEDRRERGRHGYEGWSEAWR
ncbi:hypothetical protein CC79DRAFT_654324 [Sarocladium strictum]